MKLEKLSAIGLSAYLEHAGVGDDEQVLERAAAWVHAQKPASVNDIIQFGLVDDFVNALDLPIIPKTKLLGALKPQAAGAVVGGTVMGVRSGVPILMAQALDVADVQPQVVAPTPAVVEREPEHQPHEGGGGLIGAPNLDGCWCCYCFPLGFGWFLSSSTGPDSKKDVVFCALLPFCPCREERIRTPGTNKFYKSDDPRLVDVYDSERCGHAENPIAWFVKLM